MSGLKSVTITLLEFWLDGQEVEGKALYADAVPAPGDIVQWGNKVGLAVRAIVQHREFLIEDDHHTERWLRVRIHCSHQPKPF